MPVVLDKTFKNTTRRILAPIKKAGVPADIERKVVPKFRQELIAYARQIVGDLPTTSSLQMRTGAMVARLLKGISVTDNGTIDSMRLRISGPPHAVAHEYGARIRASSLDYLAIPVLDGLRPDGRPRYRSPSSYKGRFKVFVHETKDGRKFLAYRLKADRKLRIIYRLIEEVRIKERLRLNAAYDRKSDELFGRFGKIFIAELATTNWHTEAAKGAKTAKADDRTRISFIRVLAAAASGGPVVRGRRR